MICDNPNDKNDVSDFLQRKKEILEKNKILQQNSVPINTCFSPEPNPPEKYELTKCSSSNNIRSMSNIFTYEMENQHENNYAFTKTLNQNNGTLKSENEKQSSSSASGISTPSNNSQKEDEEKYVYLRLSYSNCFQCTFQLAGNVYSAISWKVPFSQ